MEAISLEATKPARVLLAENETAMASTLNAMPSEAANAMIINAVRETSCRPVKAIREGNGLAGPATSSRAEATESLISVTSCSE